MLKATPFLAFMLLRILVCLFVEPTPTKAQTQTIPITFRLADPQRTYIRAFVPGTFNNWGPNSGGRIAIGAVSEMSYDAASGAWTKTLMLQQGARHLYKFHVHRNADGSQFEWFPDPNNPVREGPDQNSVLIAVSLAFSTTQLDSAQGMVSGLSASLTGTTAITRLVAVVEREARLNAPSDTLNFLPTLNTQTRTFRATFASVIATNRTICLFATDAQGNTAQFRFLQVRPSTPPWAASAVWYQIFPERFRNGDPSNDPTRASLEQNHGMSDKWRVKEWGSDWFARDEWEREAGSGVGGFYTSAIFHRRYGGDLQGVMQRLDYLQSLGITAIYFNPLFYAASLHKYDGNSLHHIDPYFGPNPQADLAQIARENASTEPFNPKNWAWTSADSLFLRLLAEAKRRNIRIIMDGVFNHTGRSFPAFEDIVKNQAASRFKDWYAVQAFDNPATAQNEFRYKAWENFETLPEFARTPDGTTLAEAPRQYVFDITRRWMDPNGDGNPEDGIDGWRLDVVPYMPIGFWNEWNVFVRRINAQAFTTAEIWTDQTPLTVRDGNFSAAMNYWAFLQPVKDFFINKRGTAESFWNIITSRMNAYPQDVQAAMQNMMDSHDTERLASQIVNSNLTGFPTNNAWGNRQYSVRKPNAEERELQKLIALFQMTFTGAPMLYYGTESGIWGGNDPDDRSPMNWADIRFAPQAASPALMRPVDDMNFDSTLFQFYRSVVNMRRLSESVSNPAISQLRIVNGLIVVQRVQNTGVFISALDSAATPNKRFMITLINPSQDTIRATITDPQFASPAFFAATYFSRGNVEALRLQNQRLPKGFTISLPPMSSAVVFGDNLALTNVQQQTTVQNSIHAFPQPFTTETTLQYTLGSASPVTMRLCDVLGREVWSGELGAMPAGVHEYTLSGANLPTGTYFCTMQTQFGVERVRLVKR